MNSNFSYDEIDLSFLFTIVKKHIKYFLAMIGITTIVLFAIGIYLKPPTRYETSLFFRTGQLASVVQKDDFFRNPDLLSVKFNDKDVRSFVFSSAWDKSRQQWKKQEKSIARPDGIPVLFDLVNYLESHIKLVRDDIIINWKTEAEKDFLLSYTKQVINHKLKENKLRFSQVDNSKLSFDQHEMKSMITHFKFNPIISNKIIEFSNWNVFLISFIFACLMSMCLVFIRENYSKSKQY